MGETSGEQLGNYQIISHPLNSVKGRDQKVPGFLKNFWRKVLMMILPPQVLLSRQRLCLLGSTVVTLCKGHYAVPGSR